MLVNGAKPTKPANNCLTIIGGIVVLGLIGLCISALARAPSRSATVASSSKAGTTAIPNATAEATATLPTGLQFSEICKKDDSMTAVQVQEELDAVVGKPVTNWSGWVYDVSKGTGDYTIEVGMKDPETTLFWARDVNIIHVSKEIAFQLSKKQPISFSGAISKIDNVFGTYCNPLVIENANLSFH